MPSARSISAVIPVYNSERSIAELVPGLLEVLADQTPDHEVILVDDGSADGSWAALEQLAQDHERVRALRLGRNYGQHNAILAGLTVATGEIVVTLDDDLQHRPDQVPVLLEALTDDVDVVYGTPSVDRHGSMRRVTSRISKFVFRATMHWEHAEQVSAFRAFRRDLLTSIELGADPFVSLDVMLSWVTDHVRAVPVVMEERQYGSSQYTVGRLLRHALNNLTGFSVLPLRFVTYVGTFLGVFGGVLLVYVVGRFMIQGGAVPGFSFLASALAIFGGAQLLAIGILGEYLGRMHFRTMGKPVFRVRDSVSAAGPPDSASTGGTSRGGNAIPDH